MYPSVLAIWPAFTAQFEGRIPWMYLDIRGLVTTGCGNLIDPSGLALALPWAKPDGTYATTTEILTEWQAVKAATWLAEAGAQAAGRVAVLRLSDAAIDGLVARVMASNEAALKQHPAFAGFDAWPADAQIGLLSMAWAMGPDFGPGWPLFSAACAAGDWNAAAANCWMDDAGNPGLTPRNRANEWAFATAAAAGGDPAVVRSWQPPGA